MKYYKLMTDVFEFTVGEIFNFNAKHLLMAQLSFEEQRSVIWEETTSEEAMVHTYYFADGERLVNFGDLDVVRLLH